MSKQVYMMQRRQLLSSLMTARRCGLGSVASRFQIALADLRLEASE